MNVYPAWCSNYHYMPNMPSVSLEPKSAAEQGQEMVDKIKRELKDLLR